MRQILLNKNRSKKSINNTNIIPVKLNRDVSMFHDEIMSDTINTMTVYNNEKDESKKHRFIFTLSPICTNVLFNNISEIIYKEGSSDTKVLTNNDDNGILKLIKKDGIPMSTEELNRRQAIRNTEYSNSNFEINYHCGSDIFNNHILRKKEGVSIQKRKLNILNSPITTKGCVYHKDVNDNLSETIIKDVFNTILDVNRNREGSIINNVLPCSNFYYEQKDDKATKKISPLYYYDTIKTFNESFSEIKRKNGWIGFNNPTTIYTDLGVDNYNINKCINNIEGCEFVDMCPERDLFYFTPKKNKYRKRLEYNWHYYLTYPYKSEYNDGKVLIGKEKGLPLSKFESNYFFTEYTNSSGIEILYFRCPIKHNLLPGDNIRMVFDKFDSKVLKILGIGDINNKNLDTYFYVRKSDAYSLFYNEKEKKGIDTLRFVKIVSGYKCEYYFRIFKKIGDFRNTINRLAFSNTIYGDEISQIVFTEDVNLDGLKDNRGRELTEVFITLLKNNSGYKEWYNDKNYNYDTVEYSHVFGKVTSGLDMEEYANISLPSIRKQHNIKINEGLGIKINESSSKLEEEIDKTYPEFYGDLVEFNPITLEETILSDVLHRFNTAQREFVDTDISIYGTIYNDEIYVKNSKSLIINETGSTFTPSIIENEINKGYANLAPEGYLYKPHHSVKIGYFSETIKQASDSLLDVIYCDLNEKELKIKTENNYVFVCGDIVSAVDKTNFNLYKFRVISYKRNESNEYECLAELIDSDKVETNKDNLLFFKHDINIPEYAYMLPDGTGRHIWRDVLKPSEWSHNYELYNIPFTNGAFYHHKNIIFPVRRQDPFKKYKMYVMDENGVELINNYEIPSTEIDISDDEYIISNNSLLCF